MRTDNLVQRVCSIPPRAVHSRSGLTAGSCLQGAEHYKLTCYVCDRTILVSENEALCPLCGAEIRNEWRQGRDEYQRQDLKKAA